MLMLGQFTEHGRWNLQLFLRLAMPACRTTKFLTWIGVVPAQVVLLNGRDPAQGWLGLRELKYFKQTMHAAMARE